MVVRVRRKPGTKGGQSPPYMMTDTQWKVFEVFHQQARGEPHVHVGSIHAPDAEMALVLAKEQYCRRQACVNLWVVPVEAILATAYENDDIFERGTDKSYRESWGYKTPKTVRVTDLGEVHE
jgi:ring-1,2-phenylacetyl-CoA epoxidase subunit PaaB